MKLTLKSLIYTITAILGLSIVLSSWFITPEGHVDVVKRFSKAQDNAAMPGLNWKVPIIDTTTTIEIRTRKNQEVMAAATSEQMPAEVTASMNWTANKEDVVQLFKEYGSLAQFESRVIDPKFRAVVKETVAKFTAEGTIRFRDQVTVQAREALTMAFKGLPIDVSGVNIENIKLPANYLKSIETKQTEKNLADAEEHKLAKQKLQSMQAVNTADAQKQAAMQIADGKAYQITTEAKAQAEKIKIIGLSRAAAIEAEAIALKNNPDYISLVKAKRWDGAWPTTMMGDGQGVLMDMRAK